MATIVQFVDSVAPSPAVRLDLNGSSGLLVAGDGIDLSPPPMRRALASSMLIEGEFPTASVVGNRTVKLPIQVVVATPSAAAVALGALARQLAQPNILRVQIEGMSAPVFFRTFAAPDYTLSMLYLLVAANTRAVLEIPAEPYALGLPVVVGQSTTPENANPYFETNVASWSGINGATPTRTTAQFHQGGASMRLTPDGVTAAPRAESEALPSAPGREVQVVGWLRSPGTTPTVGMTVRYYSDGAGTAFISKVGALSAIVASTWTQYTVTDFAPAGTASYRIAPEYSGTPTAGQLLDVDEATGMHTGNYLINNDPAAAVNPCILDVTGVLGDVETPAKYELDGVGTNLSPVIAVRRHGTPSNITPIMQAEAMTQGTDTSTGADALMSGGSRSRCSFATNAGMATRLTGNFPSSGGAANTDRRGLYRMFLMVASSAAGSAYAARMRVDSMYGSATLLTGDTVTYTATDTSRRLLDLGLLQVPLGQDSISDGYGPAKEVSSVSVQFQAQRVSGSGSLDFDFAVAAYADEEQLQLGTVFNTVSNYDVIIDGINGRTWVPWSGSTGEVHAYGAPPVPTAGSAPRLSVGQTNRLMLLRPDGVGTGAVRGPDTKTRTTTVRVTYWPRYVFVAS